MPTAVSIGSARGPDYKNNQFCLVPHLVIQNQTLVLFGFPSTIACCTRHSFATTIMLSFLSLGLLAVPAVHATGSTFFARDDSANATNATIVDMVSSSWYAGWHADNFTLQNVSWDKYTHLIYSFA